MTSFRLLERASIELNDAAIYYENESEGLGLEFLKEFDKGVELIVAMPEAWSLIDGHFRRFLIRRFPFSIVYRLDEDVVVVVSVFDQRSKPRRWS